ncbi:MAG TPA: hypothetical protein VND80_06160 [Steroidobacteraceae bacterium]|nr:hypothetical protein [Steroidobacteraceae bacterium]
MHPSFPDLFRAATRPFAGRAGRVLKACTLAMAAVAAAGCSNNNTQSGYGVVWVTVTAEPGAFASYFVNLDSITLTDKTGNTYTALATVEPVDFARLGNVAELWGSATVPDDTYVSATVTLDYTNAAVSVLQGGVPQKANLVGSTSAAVTTVSFTIKLDPSNPLVITPSYATSNAGLLALDLDLPASNSINTATSPATVTIHPFMTAAIAPADSKLIRVRGPLINSSVNLGTYTIYERPFYDEANNIGSLTMFGAANTIYTLNGQIYVGNPGVAALSQTSAGTTLTAAYTTFEPTTTPTGVAGKFNAVYVIAGSSLESFYTQNLTGTVIARSGNTLTVRGGTIWGSTLSFPTGYAQYKDTDSLVLVGPGTTVTADDDASLTGLNYHSIAVGQKIDAIGTWSLSSSGVVTLDATSATAGQVRLLSTEAFGQLLTGAAGSATMTLEDLAGWPAGVFTFAGNGLTTAQDTSAASYRVATGATDLSGTAAGTPLWVEGLVNGFGAAPPDFNASAVNQETAVPASLRATWSGSGTTAPFTGLSSGGFTVDLGNPSLASAVLQIGPESIDLHSLASSPPVVATSTPVSTTFAPAFAFGDVTGGISTFSSFASFVAALNTGLSSTNQALSLEARGSFDRATNTFTADTVNLVL